MFASKKKKPDLWTGSLPSLQIVGLRFAYVLNREEPSTQALLAAGGSHPPGYKGLSDDCAALNQMRPIGKRSQDWRNGVARTRLWALVSGLVGLLEVF
jgi:hypothetical protein